MNINNIMMMQRLVWLEVVETTQSTLWPVIIRFKPHALQEPLEGS